MPESPISSLAQSKSYFWKSSTLELLKAPNHKWYSLSSFPSYKVYLLCASVKPHLPSLLLSLSLLFIHTKLKLPIDSVQICALYIFAGELSASISSHPCRYKEANVILAPMNLGMRTVENSENENRERLIFFLEKSNTPRHWQVSNRSTKSCEKGIQVAANSVVMSRTLQKRTQVFWLQEFLSFLSRPPQMFQKRLHQSQLQNHQDLELQVLQLYRRTLLSRPCCGDLSSSSSVHESGPTVGLVGLLLEKERMSDLSDF